MNEAPFLKASIDGPLLLIFICIFVFLLTSFSFPSPNVSLASLVFITSIFVSTVSFLFHSFTLLRAE